MNGLSWSSQFGSSSVGTAASIHELVSGTLAKLGIPAPATVIQTVLMKDDCFIGHKLRFEGGCAIHLAGGNTVKFYDEQGTLLTTVVLEAQTEEEA